MAENQSSKHKELSEQLNGWWRAQTGFKTKKELAVFLGVHPDTLGDYFPGRQFPRADIARKLYELTKMPCLRTDSAASFSGGGATRILIS
ncbi:helix-turn-helix domain-containing protein [Chloroflexota bacterium]